MKNKSYPELADLKVIKRVIGRLPKGTREFGVELRIIESAKELQAGMQILRLDLSGKVIRKTRLRVREISKQNGAVAIETKTIAPENEAGFEGFFSESCLREIDGTSSTGVSLYLRMIESGTSQKQRQANNPLKKKTFFETMEEYAMDLKILIECWAIAYNPKLRGEEHLSFDPFEMYWLREWKKEHGDLYRHREVYNHLMHLLQYGEIQGINKIYNDGRLGRKVDYITPLLHQMQEDVLTKMFEDVSLVGIFFGENVSEHVAKRMKVFFDRYYSTREVAVGVDFGSTSSRRNQSLRGTRSTTKHAERPPA